jgi:hypothetical protein
MHFTSKLNSTRGAWAGWIGGSLVVLGGVLLAADKGAFCLTMSALGNLTEQQFATAQPALLAIFAKEGWLWITWGICLIRQNSGGICLPEAHSVSNQVNVSW